MDWKFRFLHDVLGISRLGGPARPGTLALREHAAGPIPAASYAPGEHLADTTSSGPSPRWPIPTYAPASPPETGASRSSLP